MNRQEYKSNTEPKVGQLARSIRDMEENRDVLYTVKTVGLGRLGNKVYVTSSCDCGKCSWPHGRELYYYCLAPQSEPKDLEFVKA